MTWPRVNKRQPCPVCQKPDWCCFAPDLTAVCCMRVSSLKELENGGWLHRIDGAKPKPPPPRVVEEKPSFDAALLMSQFSKHTTPDKLIELSVLLKLPASSLSSLGCAWAQEHNAWAFPMHDGNGNVIGIRLRNKVGSKWAVAGSRQGVFLSKNEAEPTVWICEGPTDTAAALAIGLFAIGRPSCVGCEPMLVATVRRLKARRVAIVADADEPGMNGAWKLQPLLGVPSVVVPQPFKDLRTFVNAGGTGGCLESQVNSMVWMRAC